MRRIKSVKGLLFYAFYSASSYLVMMLTMMLMLGGIMLTGRTLGINVFLTSGILTFSSTFMTVASKDAYSKWNRFQLAMPVKRSDVIVAKYIGHFILLLIAIVIAAVFIFICTALHKNIFEGVEGRVFGLVAMSISASLAGCSLFYPLAYTIGQNKEEALAYVCLLGGFAVSFMLWRLIRLPNFSETINAVLCIAISVILFIASFLITVKIFNKKDI